jgi:hypothetical protein
MITQIQLDIAEKTNVANILISNFASQCINGGTKVVTGVTQDDKDGLKIASNQLGSFISNLIMENGNLQLKLKELTATPEPCNNIDYDGEDGRNC